jgi:hypothetical protein
VSYSNKKRLKKRKSYEALVDLHLALPELTKMIIYDLFVSEFNSYFLTNEEDHVYKAYRIIKNYVQELVINGFVEFK